MRAYFVPTVLALTAFASTGCALHVAGPDRHFGYVDGELEPVPPHASSPRYEHGDTRLAPLVQDPAALGRSLSAAAAARALSSIRVIEPEGVDATEIAMAGAPETQTEPENATEIVAETAVPDTLPEPLADLAAAE